MKAEANVIQKLPPHLWWAIGIVVASIIGQWWLMQYQIDQHGKVIENIQDNIISQIQHDLRQSREEVDELQIRAASEDAADELLNVELKHLREIISQIKK